MNPVVIGFALEDILQRASMLLPGLTRSLREAEIKRHFDDASLNGVDHWIQVGTKHILIQDKWKESVTQQEVSQFLMCAERLRSRIPIEESVYLIWASKKEPTANSRAALVERGVSLVCCSVGVEMLARCVICQIWDILKEDCGVALASIRSDAAAVAFMGGGGGGAVGAGLGAGSPVVAAAPPLPYDETEDGKRDIADVKRLVAQIESQILLKIQNALNTNYIPDAFTLLSAYVPKTAEEWFSGKIAKVDYTSFMKAMKDICWPKKGKKVRCDNLFLYVKLRKISSDFANLANQYDAKRKQMKEKKSVWAKGLPSVKVGAEPITDADYRGALELCDDYYFNVNRDGKIERVANTGYLNGFYGYQCSVY